MAPDEVDKLRAVCGAGAAVDIPVTPDNWTAFRVFLAQEGRWLRTPTGRLEALDMAQVDATVRLMGLRRTVREAVFWKLLKLEKAALEEMAR